MLLFPNTKLNLGLAIPARRPDGFHTLETVLLPLPWTDVLEVLPAPAGHGTTLVLTGRPIPGNPATNLVLRAYALVKADHPTLPAAQFLLHKSTPIGAGLGGGSADAAFALKGINEVFGLKLDVPALQDYARQLGADCAFFIENKPVLAVEKGDVFEEIALDLCGTAVVVVFPALHIGTAEAYACVVPAAPAVPLRAALAAPIAAWPGTVTNAFEAAVRPLFPALPGIKEKLYAAGAAYASLSGSGSAVYGLFPGLEAAPALDWPDDYTVWRGVL